MAQVVGYFNDNVNFSEEPFVLTNPCGNGYRIEVQPPYNTKIPGCPCLPHPSIYHWRHNFTKWGEGKTHDENLAKNVVDCLNKMVKTGDVIRDKVGIWVVPACV